ncbi:Succinate dehydrogenase assembly factor 3, mitochondrial [Cryoendolithus antarcticus]|uniref:Succinate dehydrogenase assembly factor 3 n=1 Tax=Cryoendolithus antarcticus TaxID=1507870 RepID=A0A1V8SIP7_9PEZI|nr:Succinate dehydrogenase assembly factor 3, mitochondrial [Cryoendolithus antarcticus]OQO18475.1 Succinate dehydrogenase assembly factor 3, mitochondrial [Rachicladosporium sp. CCFEE 5018]
MRPALRLLATPTITSTRSSLRPTPPALLPPIPLYRRLLRSHRKYLPTEERLLGDEYVKAEFRAHRKIDNPMHIVGFLSEWQLYAQGIEGDGWRGEKMDREKVDKMSDEQVAQMYELMQEIKRRGQEEAEEEVAAATSKAGRGD